MTLDALRTAHPKLGFALYAYMPGGAVTLEVHDAGEVYSFIAPTEVAVIDKAFPWLGVSQTPLGAGSAPALRPTHEPSGFPGGEADGVSETPDSVFD